MTTGQRLKKLRKSKRLPQKAVAECLNCSTATYSRYENDKRQPSMEAIVLLAELFSVSTDYLLGRELFSSDGLSDYEKSLVMASREATEPAKEDVLEFLIMKKEKTLK